MRKLLILFFIISFALIFNGRSIAMLKTSVLHPQILNFTDLSETLPNTNKTKSDQEIQSNSNKEPWVLIEKKPLYLQPEITHYTWNKRVAPFSGPQDTIGLHRLIDERSGPKKGVFFVLPGMSDQGMDLIADSFLENTAKAIERAMVQAPKADSSYWQALLDELVTFQDRLIARYLAKNGYDVYTIDYRTSFVPKYTEGEDLSFMKGWGWELFLSDIKEGIEHAKHLSGHKKVFLAGESHGGMFAMNYASKYWQSDLLGLILLDGGNGGKWKLRIPVEVWKLIETELLNIIPDMPEQTIIESGFPTRLLQAFIDAAIRNLLYNSMSFYSYDKNADTSGGIMGAFITFLNTLGIPLHMYNMPHYDDLKEAAFNDILAPPVDPVTGIYLEPYNPETGNPFQTYLEWYSVVGYESPLTGLFSSGPSGYVTPLGQAVNMVHNTRHWPMELILQAVEMFDVELTTSDEPLELLGFKVNFRALPEALSNLIESLNSPLQNTTNSAKQAAKRNFKSLFEQSINQVGLGQNYDYTNGYQEIDVPMIIFQTKLGLLLWGPATTKGIKNKDVTIGGVYPDMGHIDTYTGMNVERINHPLLEWLNQRNGD